ncbi:DUF3631 domain-containing protein [Oceaniovalibus sp. ACAM 378]|uniref:DUF3631 domain-containing protein n=1 Tax=Oceaniovalibus sp. ACAM 378 TaxID=2599923 RepID=UPI0011D4270E|nr:DUF3631 domain-containing protein [Oceaniovalibus sp. ACAM 378]TYB83742.1 DUF3631 domain-containing protein [Oceaniovalibus sp. ACAM 378]
MSRRYDIRVIRDLLIQPRNIERVIQDLYGADAVRDKGAYLVGDVAGGIGRSCRFETVGQFAGRFKDFNPAGSKSHGDLIDAVQFARGCSTADAIQFLGDLLGAEPRLSVVEAKPKPPARLADDLAPISKDTLRKHRARLTKAPQALKYLEVRGLSLEILIDRFGVGLAGLYQPKPTEDAEARGNWLTAPVMGQDGALLKRMMKITVPGFSVSPVDTNGWCVGSPITTWSGPSEGKRWLFVAEGVKDLWRIYEAIRETSLVGRMVIISSTHGSGVPEEWRNPEFWAGWEKVFLGQDNDPAGEEMAKRVRQLANREFFRVEPPRNVGKDWTEFFQARDQLTGVAEFERLLDQAKAIGLAMPAEDPAKPLDLQKDGIYEDRRININGAFHGGKMYYPFQVRRVETVKRKRQAPDGSTFMSDVKASYYETKVVRSDGVMMGMSTAPAPYDVEDEDKVIVLDDGTEVLSMPKPREFSTWSWPSINSFVEKVQAGIPAHRLTLEIMADIVAFLRQLTWLPNDTDYEIIAAYVMMSYCYNAFDAIPLLLLNGEKGSGKTSLAEGIADLSFNGRVLGGGSEKAFVRFIDQGRGLLVLDDLEAVGRRGGDDGGYGDINQVLKVSYSKTTGVKSVIEKNGTTRMLNFYGPKVITNILGIDAVNATRMYQILCRPMPKAVQEEGRIRGRDLAITEPLRQELHAWGMSNIREAHRVYQDKVATRGGRAEQIAAPLETIAELAGDEAFIEAVKKAIKRLAFNKSDNLTAGDLLVQAVEAIVERGTRTAISLSQIQAELAMIPEARTLDAPGAVPRDLLPLQDPATIGRMLKALGIRNDQSGRARLSGQTVRYYGLNEDFVGGVLERAEQERRSLDEPYRALGPEMARQAFAFCEALTCAGCPYRTICEAVLPQINAGKMPPERNRHR